MSGENWLDGVEELSGDAIRENTEEVHDRYSCMFYGYDIRALRQEHIDALIGGKALFFNNGEYATSLVFVGDDAGNAIDDSNELRNHDAVMVIIEEMHGDSDWYKSSTSYLHRIEAAMMGGYWDHELGKRVDNGRQS